ncbi:MAG: hypothetical protein JXB14_01065 [Candidatus Altiarchaeota archaeon]|nr:hypothetical protein [Candidatus Altiarchaeota archaeon]
MPRQTPKGLGRNVRVTLRGRNTVVVNPGRANADAIRLTSRKPLDSVDQVVRRVKVPSDVALPGSRKGRVESLRNALAEGDAVLLDTSKFIVNEDLRRLRSGNSKNAFLGVGVDGVLRKVNYEYATGIVRWLNENGYQTHQPYGLSRMNFSYTGTGDEYERGRETARRKYQNSPRGKATMRRIKQDRYWGGERERLLDLNEQFRKSPRGALFVRLSSARHNAKVRLGRIDDKLTTLRRGLGTEDNSKQEALRAQMRQLIGKGDELQKALDKAPKTSKGLSDERLEKGANMLESALDRTRLIGKGANRT